MNMAAFATRLVIANTYMGKKILCTERICIDPIFLKIVEASRRKIRELTQFSHPSPFLEAPFLPQSSREAVASLPVKFGLFSGAFPTVLIFRAFSLLQVPGIFIISSPPKQKFELIVAQ